MDKLNAKTKSLIVVFIICILAFIYHHKYINEFPSHIHAWAQADRYALALGFEENNLNFFKPQTYVLNHEFPGRWKIPSESSITAVDFPIHDYIPGVIMKVSGNDSPWIFRLYIILYSIIGLFFLYKLSFAYTNNFIKSFFVTVLAATSPIYVYYQGSFLPTIPSLSNAIIGIYFYYMHLNKNSTKYFTFSIVFFTLGALARTTFAIPLIAIFSNEFLRLLKRQTRLFPKLYPVLISILIIVFYQFYNSYLRQEYGSMFLNYILPAENFSQVKEIFHAAFDKWIFQYFSGVHYIIFGNILIGAIYFTIREKKAKKRTHNKLVSLIIIWLIGSVIFSILMLQQFTNHDYYFLDVFFLPVIIIYLLLINKIRIKTNKTVSILSISAMVLIFSILIYKPTETQNLRRETGFWSKTQFTINNFRGASDFLDSLNIPKKAKMLVFDPYAPNIPFILMQRQGFAIMYQSKENIKNSLDWNYDYIVFQNDFFSSGTYSKYPQIINKIEKIADNGNLSVCIRSDERNKKINLEDFLGRQNDTLIYEEIVSFENTPGNKWSNYDPSDQHAFTGIYSGYMNSDISFGLSYISLNNPQFYNGNSKIFVSTYIFSNNIPDCEIVCSIKEGEKSIYYKSHNLKDIVTNIKEWNKIAVSFDLPKLLPGKYELAVYLWNTGKSNFFYDDFKVSIYLLD